jgi:uncharacterized protein YraI
MYTKMNQHWFKATLWIVLFAGLMSGLLGASLRTEAMAQEPTPGSADVFITVTNNDQVNIRSGPSTVLYDIIGYMQPGETAKALGVSPGRDWVQIVFPSGPGGVGWIYTSLISISPGNLQVVEPPPTPTPLTTPTIDPTLEAAYIFEPTVTRMPTFTPPAPLEIPHFTAMPATNRKNSVPMGTFVLITGALGVLGYLLSLLRRR